MNRKLHSIKIVLLLFLWMAISSSGQAQAFLAAGAVVSAKTARMSIGEGIAANNQEVLLDLITKAGLMPLLSNGGAYTFFAPSEEALMKYQGDTPEKLRTLFSKHIVASILTTAALKDGSDLKTIDGTTLRICRKKGAIILDGVRLEESDQLFANGIVHQLKGAFQPATSDL